MAESKGVKVSMNVLQSCLGGAAVVLCFVAVVAGDWRDMSNTVLEVPKLRQEIADVRSELADVRTAQKGLQTTVDFLVAGMTDKSQARAHARINGSYRVE